jgi:hypothetical protein
VECGGRERIMREHTKGRLQVKIRIKEERQIKRDSKLSE